MESFGLKLAQQQNSVGRVAHSQCYWEHPQGCSGEPDRPVAPWALDEHSGIWCKQNTPGEHRDQKVYVLPGGFVKSILPSKCDMHSDAPMRSG